MNRLSDLIINKTSLILLLLLILVGLFELLPIVDEARKAFPDDFNSDYKCSDVLHARPWYGQVNSWLGFWLISTPVIVFSAKPKSNVWIRASRTIFAIFISYFVINWAVHLSMDIKNAPFSNYGMSSFSKKDSFMHHCYDIADGGKYVGALLFGWIYALIYHGWWEGIWHQYHKRKTGLINKGFKTDWLNLVVVFASMAIPAIIIIKILSSV